MTRVFSLFSLLLIITFPFVLYPGFSGLIESEWLAKIVIDGSIKTQPGAALSLKIPGGEDKVWCTIPKYAVEGDILLFDKSSKVVSVNGRTPKPPPPSMAAPSQQSAVVAVAVPLSESLPVPVPHGEVKVSQPGAAPSPSLDQIRNALFSFYTDQAPDKLSDQSFVDTLIAYYKDQHGAINFWPQLCNTCQQTYNVDLNRYLVMAADSQQVVVRTQAQLDAIMRDDDDDDDTTTLSSLLYEASCKFITEYSILYLFFLVSYTYTILYILYIVVSLLQSIVCLYLFFPVLSYTIYIYISVFLSRSLSYTRFHHLSFHSFVQGMKKVVLAVEIQTKRLAKKMLDAENLT